jgi:hypothetical protein
MKKYFKEFDGSGNIIEMHHDGLVILKLVTGKTIHIGTISESDGIILYQKRVYKKYIFRKLNAWGLNAYIINNIPDDAIIELMCDDGSIYSTTKEQVKKNGQYLHFKDSDFELQIFMPIDKFQIKEAV